MKTYAEFYKLHGGTITKKEHDEIQDDALRHAASLCQPISEQDSCPPIWRQDWNAAAQHMKTAILACLNRK